jgi:hypothetical protein
MKAHGGRGRPRIYTNEERLAHKRQAHVRWKTENWEYYCLQKRLLAWRPEYKEWLRSRKKAGENSTDESENPGSRKSNDEVTSE